MGCIGAIPAVAVEEVRNATSARRRRVMLGSIVSLLTLVPEAAASPRGQLQILAHEYDDLSFMTPAVPNRIRTGEPSWTTLLIAGDAGRPASYQRESPIADLDEAHVGLVLMGSILGDACLAAHDLGTAREGVRFETCTDSNRQVFQLTGRDIRPAGTASILRHRVALQQRWAFLFARMPSTKAGPSSATQAWAAASRSRVSPQAHTSSTSTRQATSRSRRAT
ncbi:MAG: hypothetical protein CL908_19675 [Deltaproteobacteria bacterium]|nr:hypothetical protein [Deltaproteobacteria bacterium]